MNGCCSYFCGIREKGESGWGMGGRGDHSIMQNVASVGELVIDLVYLVQTEINLEMLLSRVCHCQSIQLSAHLTHTTLE